MELVELRRAWVSTQRSHKVELRLELRVMGTGSSAGTGLGEFQSQRATQSKLKGLEVCGLWVISLRCLQRDMRA